MINRFAVFCLISSMAASAVAEKPKVKKPGTRPPVVLVAKPPVRPGPAQVRPLPKQRAVEVLWGNQWWPAEILETKDGFTKIHYTGWGPEWDEWVEPSRIRSVAPRVPPKSVRVGQRLEVEWHGTWWAAEVIATKNGFTKIHYTGWGPEWDEWIEMNRMRVPTGQVGPRGPARTPEAFPQTL